MALEWAIADFIRLPEYGTEDIFQIENGSSSYFSQILMDNSVSSFQPPNEFVDASVNVRRQLLKDDGKTVIIESTISVYHFGDRGIADLSDLLRFVTNQNTTGSEEFSALDSLIGLDVKVGMVSFSNAKPSTALAASFDSSIQLAVGNDGGNDKTLLIVTVILAFALFGLSAVIVWMAMFRPDQSKMIPEIQQKPTEDTQDVETSPDREVASQLTNPSGILGMNSFNPYGHPTNDLEGLGARMSPPRSTRSEIEGEVASPMSVYTDSGRAPIGITSMRKLLANRTSNNEVEDGMLGQKLDYGE